MKKVLLIYLILIAGIITWYFTAGKEKRIFSDSKATALKVSKHSKQFNESLEEVMSNYYKMAEEFAKADTLSINKYALKLTEINGMQSDPSLQAKRESLNLFSNELFTLLLTIHYDLAKLYWQECSSAFGEDTGGNWISESEQSKNPYGKDGCATVKKVINFMPADSIKK